MNSGFTFGIRSQCIARHTIQRTARHRIRRMATTSLHGMETSSESDTTQPRYSPPNQHSFDWIETAAQASPLSVSHLIRPLASRASQASASISTTSPTTMDKTQFLAETAGDYSKYEEMVTSNVHPELRKKYGDKVVDGIVMGLMANGKMDWKDKLTVLNQIQSVLVGSTGASTKGDVATKGDASNTNTKSMKTEDVASKTTNDAKTTKENKRK